jgi:hypothetical protein
MASLPTQKPQVWAPFLKQSGLDDQAGRRAVAIGEDDPLLVFFDLGPFEGLFDHDVPTRIQIADDIANRFEQDHDLEQAQQLLQCKILHETIHWARFRGGLSGDEGPTESFESAAYGSFLRRYWQNNVPPPVNAAERIRQIADATVDAGPSQSMIAADGHGLFTSADVRERMPTGIRNNNPGNIKRGISWNGLAEPVRMKDFQKHEQVFCVFREPEWGLRAMAIILRGYQQRRQPPLRTPSAMIGAWAPIEDNNPVDSYAASVADKMGIEPDQAFDFTDKTMAIAMMKGMIPFENGAQWQPYANVQCEAALELHRVSRP